MNINSVALAKAVWETAKQNDMSFEDIIGCCALLVANVSDKSGESRWYLLNEIKRRYTKVKQ